MATHNGRSSATGSKRGSVFNRVIDLDYVLVNELGQFGRFQLTNLLLVAFPIFMSAFMTEYIFSAAAIPHRCMIPECGETTENAVYDRESLLGAFPEGESCERYLPLGCQSTMRALAGTLNSVGSLLVLPLIGIVSDHWGRRMALVISVFNAALIGLIRAFSINYPMYLTLQLLQTTLGGGVYSSAYIFAAELVGPKYRVATSATCSSMFAVGQVILALVAWVVQPWRYMIMTLHIPGFLIFIYFWLLTESVRWLLSKDKFDSARVVLEKVSRVNNKQISEKSLHALLTPASPITSSKDPEPGLIKTIIKSRVLLRRVCTTPIWWITTTFVYYGLSINSTTLPATNMYINYILTCAIEIPGFFTAFLILDRIGRKATLSIGYFLSAVCNITFAFIPEDMATLGLIVYLLGKFGISIVMTSMYLYTSELYPTQFRHSLLAFSSMIGRIGSITAPLTPVLADIWSGIPSMMFGGMGVLAGVLVLTQPETLGTKLPDTLAEAEALGSPESKLQQPK